MIRLNKLLQTQRDTFLRICARVATAMHWDTANRDVYEESTISPSLPDINYRRRKLHLRIQSRYPSHPPPVTDNTSTRTRPYRPRTCKVRGKDSAVPLHVLERIAYRQTGFLPWVTGISQWTPTIDLFTDGSFKDDIGGWAVVGPAESSQPFKTLRNGRATECTIFDLELYAILEAVTYATDRRYTEETHFRIFTDCKSAIHRLTENSLGPG